MKPLERSIQVSEQGLSNQKSLPRFKTTWSRHLQSSRWIQHFADGGEELEHDTRTRRPQTSLNDSSVLSGLDS